MRVLLKSLLAASFVMSSCSVRAQSANPPATPIAASGQQVLDLFAAMPIPSTPASPGAPYLPKGPFKSWTNEEQAAIPGQIQQTCKLVWIMAHDTPGTRFLPAKSPDDDELVLGADVCVAGHMPRDWPERASIVAASNAILERSRPFGGHLVLPTSIGK